MFIKSSSQECCQKLHKVQQVRADSPEQLLRARFSAHIKKDWKYIVRTTHSKNEARRGSTAKGGKINSSFEQDVKVSMSWGDFSKLEVLKVEHMGGNAAAHREEGAQAFIDFKYKIKQLFELETGQKMKDPLSQDVRETAIFEVEEGDWRLLISHSNWDRNTLQASTADEIIPAA
jgi:SEC-C motif-containing protein